MRRNILLGIACIGLLVLAGCANNTGYFRAQVRSDLATENWMRQINLNPNLWTQHADRWFYTDEPESFEQYANRAPMSSAMTAMMVRVPNFTNISVDGPFKVQIVGRQAHNSVFVIGPNAAARHAAIEVRGNTLLVHPAYECANSACADQGEVTVRIGVRDLRKLVVTGTGLVEGKELTTNSLDVVSTNCAEILLMGNMNVAHITQTGGGVISMSGVYSPQLDMRVGDGSVNVAGHVGIHSIVKQGRGNINIIGADTDSLTIDTSGMGTTAIAGYANVKKVSASGDSRVYLYWSNSNGMYVNVHQNARVGLAGFAKNMDANIDGNARFEGKYLHVDNIYISTRNNSHANVSPTLKLFANAQDNSSIYFFSSPNVVSRYTTDKALIIPVWNDNPPIAYAPKPMMTRSKYRFQGAYKGVQRRGMKGEW